MYQPSPASSCCLKWSLSSLMEGHSSLELPLNVELLMTLPMMLFALDSHLNYRSYEPNTRSYSLCWLVNATNHCQLICKYVAHASGEQHCSPMTTHSQSLDG